MPATQCCAVGCSARGGFRFPSDPKLKKAWMDKIKRKNWKPSVHSVVCNEHFDSGDIITHSSSGLLLMRQKLCKNAIPKNFVFTEVPKPSLKQEKREVRASRRLARYNKTKQNEAASCDNRPTDNNGPAPACDNVANKVELPYAEAAIHDIEMDTTSQFKQLKTVGCQTQTTHKPRIDIESIKDLPEVLHYYTGLESYAKFRLVLQSLGGCAYHLEYKWRQCTILSVEDQFLLTLVKLRRYMPNFELSFLFGISTFTVSNIFWTWINFMFDQWSELNLWPSRDLVSYYMPKGFKQSFPSTRVILDGMEIPIKKPGNPTSQQATFSSYKHRNTLKVIVGITPGGFVSYVSPAYGGSTSDRQIIERNSLMTMCEMGDSIMADRGINVQDLFAPYDVQVNIPTFMKGKNQLSGLVVVSDRKVASKRVHVERLIGLGKTYKILTNPLNNDETKMGSEIIFICLVLCNFRNCIVGNNC